MSKEEIKRHTEYSTPTPSADMVKVDLCLECCALTMHEAARQVVDTLREMGWTTEQTIEFLHLWSKRVREEQ